MFNPGGPNDFFGGLGLGDFLKSLDFFDDSSSSPTNITSDPPGGSAYLAPLVESTFPSVGNSNSTQPNGSAGESSNGQQASSTAAVLTQETDPTVPKDKTERYLMTAADQKDASRDERLARVIHAKFEAGLLQPHDYVKVASICLLLL
jgi:hypothetical protein